MYQIFNYEYVNCLFVSFVQKLFQVNYQNKDRVFLFFSVPKGRVLEKTTIHHSEEKTL